MAVFLKPYYLNILNASTAMLFREGYYKMERAFVCKYTDIELAAPNGTETCVWLTLWVAKVVPPAIHLSPLQPHS